MIQRKQSIYLLVAFTFGIAMFFTNQIGFSSETSSYVLNFKGISEEIPNAPIKIETIALSILLFLTPLVSFTSIFLFKKRMIQIRLCAANIGLLLGTTGLIYYFGTIGIKELDITTIAYNISMAFPIAGAILCFLALRLIGKDEALIRSMDRIR